MKVLTKANDWVSGPARQSIAASVLRRLVTVAPSGLGLARAGLGLWSAGVFGFLYLPIVVLAVYSFNASRLNIRWTGFTLRWYGELGRNPPLLEALANSLVIACAATAVSVVLGTGGAWLLHRYRFRGGRAIQTLLGVPLVMPEIVMGIGLLVLFTVLHVQLGFGTVIVAHITFCFPFVLVAVQARLAGLDPALEEAALDLGATPARAFWLVTIPGLRPAIVAGALLAFTLSMDELIVTFFTASPDSATLPLRVFGLAKVGLSPVLNALSTLLIVATVAGVWGAARFGRRARGAAIALGCVLLAVGGARATAADSELTIFTWSEYVPTAVLTGFSAETGVRVRAETFSSGEEMLAKLLTGGTAYDVIQPPDYIAEALIRNGLLRPLDYGQLPHFANILPEFRRPAYDPDQRFTVPYLAGIAGIVVNTARVTRPIRGFADLFAPEFKDRIVVMDDGRELVTAALYTLGLGTNDITPATLARVRPVLARWFQLIKLFDSDSPKTALLNGDVDLGYVWCGEAALLWNQDHRFRFVLPAEGYHRAVDVLAIPRSAPHPGAAHRFIDYVLRADVSRRISEAFPYTNPNGAARRLLTPEELANPASYPAVRPPVPSFRHLPGTGELVDALVTDLKNAR